MEKVAKVFHSFAAADDAEDAFYASLTPQERVNLLLELISSHLESLGEAATGFERVYRVTQLSQR